MTESMTPDTGLWIEWDNPKHAEAQRTMDAQRNMEEAELKRLAAIPPTIQRWYPNTETARQALAAEGLSPRTIASVLTGPPPPWKVTVVDDAYTEPQTYMAINMATAIQMVLGWCDEYGVDGLEALRQLEQASSDGAKSITHGPFTIEEESRG
jgi:hypothetical protein